MTACHPMGAGTNGDHMLPSMNPYRCHIAWGHAVPPALPTMNRLAGSDATMTPTPVGTQNVVLRPSQEWLMAVIALP